VGQYHSVVSLDAPGALRSRLFGGGVKLMGQAPVGWGGVPTALALAIGEGGAWHGQRIAVIGDYAEVGDLPDGVPFAENPHEAYELSDSELSERLVAEIDERYEVSRYVPSSFDTSIRRPRKLIDLGVMDAKAGEEQYVVNLDARTYLDPHAFGCARTFDAIALTGESVMMATMILLAVSNGRGGGDFGSQTDADRELVGSWGGQRVVIGPRPVDGVDISEAVAEMVWRCEGEWFDQDWTRIGAVPQWLLRQLVASGDDLASVPLLDEFDVVERAMLAGQLRGGVDYEQAVGVARGLARAVSGVN